MRNVLILTLVLSGVGVATILIATRDSSQRNVIVYGEQNGTDEGLDLQTAMRPNVARLLNIYQHPRLSRPAERLCLPLSRIHDLLSESSPEELSGLKTELLVLQTGLRLYKKAHPELKPLIIEVKELEDRYGWAADARRTAELGRKKGAPEEVQAVLDQRVASTELKLATTLQERWTPKNDGRIPAVSAALKRLAVTRFAVGEQDAAYIQKRFRAKLKKLSRKEYDLTKFEGDNGVHELRRDLRRIRHMAVSTDGLVQFSRNDSTEGAPKHGGVASYAWLPRPNIDSDHLFLSSETYKAALDATAKLASVKTTWEHIEAIKSAFQESNVETAPEFACREALQLLGLPPSEPDRLVADAKRIYAGVDQADIFLSLRRDLKMRSKRKPASPKQERQ